MSHFKEHNHNISMYPTIHLFMIQSFRGENSLVTYILFVSFLGRSIFREQIYSWIRTTKNYTYVAELISGKSCHQFLLKNTLILPWSCYHESILGVTIQKHWMKDSRRWMSCVYIHFSSVSLFFEKNSTQPITREIMNASQQLF